jgi:nucleoside-diphosphate-sugar epimerase
VPDVEAALRGQDVMVTGAGGFIGSALAAELLRLGAAVRGLAGAPGQDTSKLPVGMAPVHADIAEQAVLDGLAAGAAVCFHLAGPPSVAGSFEAPLEYARVHVLGTLAMLEACRRAGVRRFVYLSSAEVYGRADAALVAENRPPAPRSPYAAAKAAAEQYVGAWGQATGFETVVLRPFSVYGPRLAARSVLGTILRQAREADEIVLADLRPVRDFVYLDDVVEGMLRAATLPLQGRTFNLGTGVGTSVETVARTAVRVAGRQLPIRCDPSRRRPSEAEIHHLVADPTRAAEALGWRARVPLEEGLRRTLHAMAPG